MKTWKIVFTVWVMLWAMFFVRGLAKGGFKKITKTCCKTYEEKKTYVLGKELKIFLDTCVNKIPESSTYKITGTLEEHDKFRIIYYLYPRREAEKADYLLNINPANSQYVLSRLK